MTDYQYMWMIYLAGAVGCTLATWLLFRRAGRAWVHFFVITVMVLLFTPYAVDTEKMTMAPAIYTLVFGFLMEGFAAVKPVLKLMLGLWLLLLIVSLIYQLLTRNRATLVVSEPVYGRDSSVQDASDQQNYSYSRKTRSSRNLSAEERQAREELLRGEEPIRAIR